MSEHQAKINFLSNEIIKKYKTSHKDFINLVQQLKFVYGDEIFIIISDALARISNDLLNTRVTALYLVVSQKRDKLSLDEIHFASKLNQESQANRIKEIINYCFDQDNTIERVFVAPSFKNRVKIFLSELDKDKTEKIFDSNSFNTRTDRDFLVNLYNSIELVLKSYGEYLKSNPKILQTFHYIVIIYLDMLIIKDILSRNFVKNDGLRIQPVNTTERNCHPDASLALYISSNINHEFKYIGLSHLCCAYCSTF